MKKSHLTPLVSVLLFCTPGYSQPADNSPEAMFAAADKAFNDHNMKEYLGYFSDDCVFYNSTDYKSVTRGKQAVENLYNGWFSLVPDLSIKVRKRYIISNTVVEEFEMNGTVKVLPPGYPENLKDKSFSVKACSVAMLENGKIKTLNLYYDYLSMLNQLGWTNIVPGR